MKKKDIIFVNPTLNKNSQNKTPVLISAEPTYPQKTVQEHTTKFHRLVSQSQRVLFHVRAVFPFDFFPDSLVIDETKVNIVHRDFFFISEIQSLPVDNIQDVIVNTSFIFAALRILPVGFSERWITVEYLRRRDAIRARRIILGLLLGKKEGIDFEHVDTPHFIRKIEQLGTIM